MEILNILIAWVKRLLYVATYFHKRGTKSSENYILYMAVVGRKKGLMFGDGYM